MRIVVHDFAGHPFQIQLSRWLAASGHTVFHAYCADIETPRGALEHRVSDPGSFSIVPVSVGRQINKYNLVRRAFDERRYGHELIRTLSEAAPDIVISGNTSPIVQAMLRRWTRRHNVAFVYWLQDIFTVALAHAYGGLKRMMLAPALALLRWLEFGTLSTADGAVVISEDFRTLLAAEGVRTEHVAVVENWAPADEVPLRPKDNPWSRQAGIAENFVFLYSGTLGLKHNPGLLSSLAKSFADDPDVRVVVISNGLGREWLEARKREEGLDNLLLFDFVPFETVPDCLGAADIQVAVLEPHAGVLSVPSKVLTYIAAEKPILGAIPPENLAAKIITRNGLGLNVHPLDVEAFVRAAHRFYESRTTQGYDAALRAYKEAQFDIERIGARFLNVFEGAQRNVKPFGQIGRTASSS